jgi:CubicO group peptidase (beta-lactamase class C family)
VLGALLTACFPLDAATTPRTSLADGAAQSDALLTQAIDGDGPGCASAVVINDELAWSGEAGLADVDAGRPIDATTRFDIASVSKQFTGLAVLRLAEEGLFSPSDSVADVLDLEASWADEVTINDLLHHTSGIPDYTELLFDAGFELDDVSDQGDALDVIEGTELEFEPGDRFSYSNSNSVLLASIAEAASGTDFATILAREVYPDTAMRLEPASTADDVALSYEDGAEARVAWLQVGDGSVVATATELAQWGTIYADTSDPAVRAMTEGAVDDDEGGQYGAGIVIDPGGNLSHSGGWAGFETLFWVSADRSTVMSLLCNSTDLGNDLIADGLLTIWE